MTSQRRSDNFDRLLTAWFDADARVREPEDLLGNVLERTSRARRRPAWLLPEWWIPMQLTMPFRAVPRLAPALRLLIALLLALALAIISIGSARRLPAPFGTASNGVIAFADGDRVMAASADGTNVRSFISSAPRATSLTWSPDGTHVAFRGRQPDGSIGLMVADADGANVVHLTTIDSEAGPLSWSPDSKRIVFELGTVNGNRPFIAHADGAGVTQVPDLGTSVAQVDRLMPMWSPDGQWIAYVQVTLASEGADEVHDVYVVHPDGTGVRKLKTSLGGPGASFGFPSWAPDPRVQRLAYSAGADVVGKVFIYDLVSDTEMFVGPGFWATWSPDASRIAWSGEGIRVATVADVIAGNPVVQRIGDAGTLCLGHPGLAGALCGPPTWSPDGTKIYGPDVLGTSIVVITIDGSQPVVKIPLGARINPELPVTPAGWQRRAP